MLILFKKVVLLLGDGGCSDSGNGSIGDNGCFVVVTD